MGEAKAVQPSSTPERRGWPEDANRLRERGPDDLVPRAPPDEEVLVPCGQCFQELGSAALIRRSRRAHSVDLLLERAQESPVHGAARALRPVLPVPGCEQLERDRLELVGGLELTGDRGG